MSGKRRADDGRVVLGLWHATVSATSMQAAAELAQLLSLGLYGLYVEDESLLAMAALPFAREIRLTTHTWTPLSADALEAEMREAALQAQQLLNSAAKTTGIACVFEVVRGDPFSSMAAACRSGDILVIAEQTSPGLPGPRGAWPLPDAVEPGCSILLLPARPRRAHGSIAVLLADALDPALETACGVAAATGEDLAILLPEGTAPEAARDAAARARAAGLLHQRITARNVHGGNTKDWLDAMGELHERLVVLGRTAPLAAIAPRIAAARGVPVLLAGDGVPA
jgi:hypothetical protein